MRKNIQASILPITTATLAFLSWTGAKINWPYGLCALLVIFLIQRVIASGRYEDILPRFSNIRNTILRDLVTLFALAFLPATAISFIAAGNIDWSVLMVVLPIGMMTNGIFLAGSDNCTSCAKLYAFDIVFPFIWVGICSVTGLMPMHTIIVFLTLAVALGCAKTMLHAAESNAETYMDLDARTSNLHVLFSLLLAIAFLLPRFI